MKIRTRISLDEKDLREAVLLWLKQAKGVSAQGPVLFVVGCDAETAEPCEETFCRVQVEAGR